MSVPAISLSSPDKMDTDSFPEVEAIVKYEDESCPAPSENEQADVFLETEVDIKYEFPEPPPPKKKRRGRPPSKKGERFSAKPSSNGPQSKSCAVKPSIGKVREDNSKDMAPPNNEADNFIPSNRESEDAEIDCGGTTRASGGENQNYQMAEGSTEMTKRIVPSLTISYEFYKTLELKMNEVTRERDALQAKLKASLEANKELELEMNKVTVERDSLKVSLEQMEQKFRQLEATKPLGDATSMRENESLSEVPSTSRKRKSLKSSGNEKGQGQPKPKMSAVVECLSPMKGVDGQDIDDNMFGIPNSNQTISEFDSMDGLANNASDCSTGLNANLLHEPSTSKSGAAFPTEVVNRREEPERNVKLVATEPSALFREAGENDDHEEELILPNYPVNSTSFFNNSIDDEDLEEEPSNFLVGDVVVLKTIQAIQSFLDKANLKPEENPFPAKSLILYVNDKNLNLAFELEKETTGMKIFRSKFFNRFLSNINELFEKYGRYIHTLQIKCLRLSGVEFVRKFETVFIDFLSSLPNLKEFEIIKECWYGRCICSSKEEFLILSPDLELPLEYLGLGGCNNSISIALLNRYGHQLKKLVMNRDILESACFQIQVNSFIHLHELELHEPFSAPFQDCAFPNLVKLTGSNFEVLKELNVFPKLKYLELKLQTEFINIRCEALSRLEYIVLPYSENINYTFLSKFPDLKQIKFVSGEKKDIWMPGLHLKKSDLFPDIHEMIATDKMYESNIWEVLPQLEKVSTEWEEGPVSFHRNDYNRHQQLLNQDLVFKSSFFKSRSEFLCCPSTTSSLSQVVNKLPSLPPLYINRRMREFEDNQEDINYLTEEEFFHAVENFSTKTIAIYGQNGMGKTKFLAQLGRKIRRCFPDRKLFYLEVKDVFQAVKEKCGVDKVSINTELIWGVLQRLTGESDLGNDDKSLTKTELFFDGFDKVKCEHLVYSILECISASLESTSVRIWIANEPRDLKQMKEILQNVVSYYIEPLDEASQVELIASYWEKQTSKDKPTLVKLAKQVVQFQMNLESKKFELGNPFHCLIMGAACLEDRNFIDYKDPSYFKTERIIKLVREWNSNSKINAGF